MNDAKILARAILTNCAAFRWSLQGMGMLRLHLPNDVRLHVWDSRYRVPGVSMIHDHLQWGLHSTVIAGILRNKKYVENELGVAYMTMVIKPGYGSYVKEEPRRIGMIQLRPWGVYQEGESYSQTPSEIHETDAEDGTVTLMRKTPTTDESARVFWEVGTQWGTAEPRAAMPAEVDEICGHALRTWFTS